MTRKEMVLAITLAAVIVGAVISISIASQTADVVVNTKVIGGIEENDSEVFDNFETLTIGFIPTEKAEELTPRAEELEKYLEEEFGNGIDVKVLVPTNYETLIEGLRFGHIDAAFMDTGPAWIAHQRSGAEVVLAEVVKGKVNYQATIWTKADNDSIQTLSDTVGKRVAFTSITGSSGFIRPMGTLVANGDVQIQGDDLVALEAALADTFESYIFAGGYKAALELLLNDNVDVAFGSDIAPQKYLTLEQQNQLRVVETIGPVPSHVFVVSPDLPTVIKNVLVNSLIKLNYDENNQILKNIYGADALLPTTTTMHIGDFGDKINSLTGIEQKLLEKKQK